MKKYWIGVVHFAIVSFKIDIFVEPKNNQYFLVLLKKGTSKIYPTRSRILLFASYLYPRNKQLMSHGKEYRLSELRYFL